MPEIFQLASPNSGKVVAQCSTLEACLREAAWRGDAVVDGVPTTLRLEVLSRQPFEGFSFAAARRYMAPWPQAKVDEFRADYTKGLLGRELEEKYDAPTSSLLKRARALGLPHKQVSLMPWAQRGGRMTPWQNQRAAVLDMIRQGLSNEAIALELNRTQKAVADQRRAFGYPTHDAIAREKFFALVEQGKAPSEALDESGPFYGAVRATWRIEHGEREADRAAKREARGQMRASVQERRASRRAARLLASREREINRLVREKMREMVARAQMTYARAQIERRRVRKEETHRKTTLAAFRHSELRRQIETIQYWDAMGAQNNQIAEILGVSKTRVWNLRVKHGMPKTVTRHCAKCDAEFRTRSDKRLCKRHRSGVKDASGRILPVSENWTYDAA